MRYVEARLKEYNRDLAYRIFITDSVGALAQANVRWIDWIRNNERKRPSKQETPNQIVDRIKNGLKNIG